MKRLVANIRTARLRHRLRIEDVAVRIGSDRIGVSLKVMAGIEKVKPTTVLATYLGALWALGLIDDMRLVDLHVSGASHLRVNGATFLCRNSGVNRGIIFLIRD